MAVAAAELAEEAELITDLVHILLLDRNGDFVSVSEELRWRRSRTFWKNISHLM